MDGAALRVMLGKKIKQLRMMRDMTQVELAKALGFTSTGTISQVESGERGLKPEHILTVAKFFGIHPAVLNSSIDLDDEELKIVIDIMKLLEKKKRNPVAAKPYLQEIRRVLGS